MRVQLCVKEYAWNLSSRWNGLSHLSIHCLIYISTHHCLLCKNADGLSEWFSLVGYHNVQLLQWRALQGAGSGRGAFAWFSRASLSRFCTVRVPPGSSSSSVCICAYFSLIPADMTADSTQEPVVFHGTPSGEFAVECLPRLLPVNSIPWHTFGGLSWKSLENSRKLLVHHLSNFTTIWYVLPWPLQWGLGWSLQVRDVFWSTVSDVGIDGICVSRIF